MTTTEPSAASPSRTRRRMPTLIRNVALVGFGLLLAWLVLEIALRVAFDALPPGVQAVIQHVRRLPWAEDAIIPVFPYIIDRDFQARLPTGLRDYPVHWSDARFTFDTISIWEGHRAGLRTDPPRWPLDVMVFGDSFGFCWTPIEDCWVPRLAEGTGWHIVNASIPGTGPGGQLNLMREVAGPTQPALIIWQWFTNDVTDDYDLARIRGEVEELRGGPLPDPVRLPRGIGQYSAVAALVDNALDPPLRDSPYRHFQDVILNGRRVSVRTDEYPHLHAMAYPSNVYGLPRNLAAHAEGVQLAESVGAQAVIVFIPSKEEAYASLLTEQLGAAYGEYIDQIGEARRALLAQCGEQGWHCLDPLPAFQEAINGGQTIYYAFDAHLDATGNRLLAELVQSYIAANDLLLPRQ